MAMTVATGNLANIVFKKADGTTLVAAKIAATNVQIVQGSHNVSAFGSGSWGDFVTSQIKSLSGSCSGYVIYGVADSDPVAFMASAVNAVITWATGCTWTTGITISGLQMGTSWDGVGVLSFDFFKSDGADPAIVWVEA